MGCEPLSSDRSVLPMGDWKRTATKRGLTNEWSTRITDKLHVVTED
jgi:hypothetical protein